MERKTEWFDDDRLWRDLYPFLFPEARFEQAVEDTPKIVRLTNPPGRDVLDLCCGPGRFAIAFAHAGYRVTGVDRTSLLLHKARQRAEREDADIEWVEADMRDFSRPQSYDLVLNMFTSFGYFEKEQDNLQVLKNIVDTLRPNGVLILDVVGKEWLARAFQSCRCDCLPDGTRLVQRHEIVSDWTRVRNEWIVIRGNRAKTFRFQHTIYSGQELRDRLEAVGFESVELYGSLEGTGYGPAAPRLVAVGRMPG